jgi:hypothetical protein
LLYINATLDEKNLEYWIDGLKGFESKTIYQGGTYISTSVDPNEVLNFILDLADNLGGRNFIHEIVYDQFDSTSPVSTLQKLGFPAIETTFTPGYKTEMYGNFLQKLALGQVKIHGVDPEGWVDRWKLELKYLQRITQGNRIFYQHPTSGPVQHDDFADVTANLVHRLCLMATPTKESVRESRLKGGPAIRVKKMPKGIIGGKLTKM